MPRKPEEAKEPAASGKDKSKKQAKLTPAGIDMMYEDGRQETAGARLIYWLNTAFWLGAQWLYAPDGPSSEITLVEATNKQRREQATANKVQPSVHNMVARTMKTETVVEVMAGSADDFAQEGARIAESVVRHKALEDDHESTVKEKWVTAALLGGVAGMVTEWDTDANRYSPDLATGDCKITALTIEDFVVEPGSAEPKRARWWIRKQVLPAEVVQGAFDLPELPTEDASAGGPFSKQAFGHYSVLQEQKGTKVLWYFERPNPLRPEGAVAAVVGKQWAMKPIAWPFPFKDRLNLETGVCIENPETWMGETPVTQVLSVQRQINHLLTKIHELNHRTAGSKLVIDGRDKDLTKELDDDPAVPIYTNSAADSAKPFYLDAPKLPSYVMQAYTELSNIFDTIMGVHAVSRGDTPSNSPDSGFGLSILAENDTTPVGRLIKEYARVYANSITNMLELYSEKVKDKRTARVVLGPGDGYFTDWTGKDLAGQTRAIVPPDSVLPKSHAGILQMAEKMLQMKPEWFPTPASWMRFARLPDVDDISEKLDRDSALAKWENGRMRQGVVVQVNEFDDDAKHIQEHHDEMKSPRYMALPEKNREVFRLHVEAHKRAAQEKQGQAMGNQIRQQMALPPELSGLGGGPAGPSGALPEPGVGLEDSGGSPFVPQIPAE